MPSLQCWRLSITGACALRLGKHAPWKTAWGQRWWAQQDAVKGVGVAAVLLAVGVELRCAEGRKGLLPALNSTLCDGGRLVYGYGRLEQINSRISW